jgi:3,4-dihydroxy-2-butanone 4-phosphate synthase
LLKDLKISIDDPGHIEPIYAQAVGAQARLGLAG